MALRIDHDGAMFRCTMDVDGAHMPHRGNQLTRSARNLILLLPLLSIRAAALPSGALPLRIRVGILVYEGVYDTEFVAPLDVFRHAATYTSGRLEAFTVAPHGGAVRTAEGLRFQPDYSFRTAPIIDWLIVPSGKNSDTDMKDKNSWHGSEKWGAGRRSYNQTVMAPFCSVQPDCWMENARPHTLCR